MSCLFSREEFDLLGLLRSGAHDDELVDRWQDAMWDKPRATGWTTQVSELRLCAAGAAA